MRREQQRKWGGPPRYVVRSGRNEEAEGRIQSKDPLSGLGRVEQDAIVASEKGNVELAGPGCSRLGLLLLVRPAWFPRWLRFLFWLVGADKPYDELHGSTLHLL
jgi:hypothetical protein